MKFPLILAAFAMTAVIAAPPLLAQQGPPPVTVGSNVADGVFVGAKQPIGSGSASVQVEVEVFDNITIDSEFGPDVGTSIGLNWKKDF
jgi:autotransporter translocation and assembly factor TamB